MCILTIYSTVLYRTVQYCTIMYCTVLYHTVLYCTGLDWPILNHTVTFLADTQLLIKLNAWSFRQKVCWVVGGWHCNYSFKLQVQVRLWERPRSWYISRPWNLTWPGSFGPGLELDNKSKPRKYWQTTSSHSSSFLSQSQYWMGEPSFALQCTMREHTDI